MFKKDKRKLFIFITILIFIIIFISVIFVLINFNIQKKQSKVSLVLKNIDITPVNCINIKSQEKIVENKYKNYHWRIEIPKINLDAPILDGTQKEILRKGVGHFENTGLIAGNICLAAHNRGYKYNYFQEIKKLEIGDIILYQFDGHEKKFNVTENKVIEETDLSVIENTIENKLTLITCEENKRDSRRCVIAQEIL